MGGLLRNLNLPLIVRQQTPVILRQETGLFGKNPVSAPKHQSIKQED
jgi:hypothetical protein